MFFTQIQFVYAESNSSISEESNSVKSEKKAGITPDSLFWNLDRAFEKLQLLFTFNPIKKAELKIAIADERLAEIEVLAEEDKIESLNKAEDVRQIEIAEAENIIQTQANKDEVIQLGENLQQHKIKLNYLNEKIQSAIVVSTNETNGTSDGTGGGMISVPYNEPKLRINRTPVESDIIELTEEQKRIIDDLIRNEEPEILQRTSYSYARKILGNSSLVAVSYDAPKVIESDRAIIIVDLDKEKILSIEKNWWD